MRASSPNPNDCFTMARLTCRNSATGAIEVVDVGGDLTVADDSRRAIEVRPVLRVFS